MQHRETQRSAEACIRQGQMCGVRLDNLHVRPVRPFGYPTRQAAVNFDTRQAANTRSKNVSRSAIPGSDLEGIRPQFHVLQRPRQKFCFDSFFQYAERQIQRWSRFMILPLVVLLKNDVLAVETHAFNSVRSSLTMAFIPQI